MATTAWFSSSDTLLLAVAVFKRGESNHVGGCPRLEYVNYKPGNSETESFSSWIKRACTDLNISGRLLSLGISGHVEKELWLMTQHHKRPYVFQTS